MPRETSLRAAATRISAAGDESRPATTRIESAGDESADIVRGRRDARPPLRYKCAQTFEEMLEKGAKKADVANDVAKGFCKLQDAEQQERIMGMRKPVAPKAKKEKSEASEPAEDAPPDDEPADEKPAREPRATVP